MKFRMGLAPQWELSYDSSADKDIRVRSKSATAGSISRQRAPVKLPNGDRAVVDLAKLRDYCLNEQHLRGRHKARVFSSALGITSDDAEILRQTLLDAAVEKSATLGEQDDYGQRYVLDFRMTGPRGSATVRSRWIILTGEKVPRLVTCYVL